MLPMGFKKIIIISFLLIFYHPLIAQEVVISVSDTIYNTIGDEFFGIQYHSNTYDDDNATGKLDKLHLKRVRIWARIAEFHPRPGVWNWEELDLKIAEIVDSGYKPISCLYQGKDWFIGSPDNPWWHYQDAIIEWENAAYQFANQYKDDIDMVIIFDEPNMMHPEKDYYITFKESAQLYIKAAEKIKSVNPNILCGGSSSFGGWENGHWANYVLNEPTGNEVLDFISCNIFLSWNADDSDELIMDRTIWYEEAPQKIKEMLGENCPSVLVLDAYNVSAIWKKDDELWTDPRNINTFGGIYQATALLHSAKGGYQITLHWETLGGYGILNWYPEFNELAPYYSWKFLIEIAGLTDNAQIIGCTTTETPKANAPHHGGMNVNLYTVQPFAIRRTDGGISVILINKYSNQSVTATINVPNGIKSYAIYRYDEFRLSDCFLPLEEAVANQVVELSCPPFSVSVIKFEKENQTGVNETACSLPNEHQLLQNYPNPFNSSTIIEYFIQKPCLVQIRLFNHLGQEVRTLVNEQKIGGKYKVFWDGKDEYGMIMPVGIFFIRMQVGNKNFCKKILYLKF